MLLAITLTIGAVLTLWFPLPVGLIVAGVGVIIHLIISAKRSKNHFN